MIYILIIGIVVIIISIIALFNIKTKNDLVTAYILGLIGVNFISGSVLWLVVHKYPTAMDVYQGKTTLEITYKEGIAIDSIVVFKTK